MLAQEIVASGIQCTPLRDEIYCQIAKHLIDNPGQQSVAQAWKALGLCTLYFAPSTDLSNYIHVFIRDRAPSHLKELLTRNLYTREYDGPVRQPPTPDQISSVVHQFA